MSTISSCNYCNRHFKYQDLYERHVLMCEFFSRRKREKERDLETFEHMPTQHELFKLVQHLLVQTTSLQKEVDKLKNNADNRTRKLVINSLNIGELPTSPFEDWILIKRPIKLYYLDLVYQEDLITGIKKYISELIIAENINIPIRTFAEKPNTIYVYSREEPGNTPSWKIMPIKQFMKWINRIAHRFSQEFSIMQAEIFDIHNSSEAEKDKNIIFMMKINGGKVSEEKRANDIRKWIIGNLQISRS